MTKTNAMQQGAAAGPTQAQVDAEVARQVELAVAAAQRAASNADQAASEATQAAQGAPGTAAPGQPDVRIGGPDGPLVIRDGNGRETIIIEEGAIPPWLQDGPPEGVFMVPIALFASIAFVIVGLPIARAFGRRMDAKNATPAAIAAPAELRQLQTSIDTMAIEIERMSEHQRFLTRVLSERTGESLAAPRDAARLPTQ